MKLNKKMDSQMFMLTMLLIAIGLIMLFSASYAMSLEESGNPYNYVLKQAAFAALGIAFMYFFVYFFDYHWLHKLAVPIYVIAILLLLGVAIFGKEVNYAKRWLTIFGIQFQPSEAAKTAIIILFSSMSVKYQKDIHKFKDGLLIYLLLIGGIIIFTLMQPHLSASIIIALTGIIIIFVGGANVLHLCGIGFVGIAGVTAFIFTNAYAMTRIKVWFDPFIDATNKGWQGAQSFIAIGSGGLFGLGFGQSRQKHLFLPEPANDFIFPVICEELGLVGACAIIILFALFIWRGFTIAFSAKDKFGMLLGVGIISKFALQTIINLFVVTGLAPITGASLPFFSYGGTALVIQIVEIGILLNISRQTRS